MVKKLVEVVMPVYNGSKYIENQILSIYSQSHRPERLIIRDDQSTDETIDILNRMQKTYGDWIYIINGNLNLGCVKNSSLLLQATTAEYVALSDQDDIWMAHKLEYCMNLMNHFELLYGDNIPILIHSDLELINRSGSMVGSKYCQFERIDPTRTSLDDLLFTNVVTGCTSLINRPLVELALPIPNQALMHDWWLALVASSFGKIGFYNAPTVYYRQHSLNVVGAKGRGYNYWLSILKLTTNPKQLFLIVESALFQATLLENRYNIKISHLSSILMVKRLRRWPRLLIYLTINRPSRHGFFRTLAFYIILFIMPPYAKNKFYDD